MKRYLAVFAFLCFLVACEDRDNEYYPVWTPSLVAIRGDRTISLNWYRPFFPLNCLVTPSREPLEFEIYIGKDSPGQMEKVATLKNKGEYVFTVNNLENGSYYYAKVLAKGFPWEKFSSNTVMVIPGADGRIERIAGDERQSMESGALASDHSVLAFADRNFTWNDNRYGAMALFTVDLQSQQQTIIDTFCYYPDWSPSGYKLVFCTDKNECATDGHIPQQIAIFEKSSSRIIRLTEGNHFNSNPEFSPDGDRIVYSSDSGHHSSFELWIMAADGSQKVPITGNLCLSGQNFGNIGLGRPVWSPDAEYIYFNRPSDEGTDMDIFRLPSAGGPFETVIKSPWNDYIPAVSPDHSKIAFISDRSGTNQIWIYEPAVDRYRQVTSGNSLDIFTYWGKLEWTTSNTILFSGYERENQPGYGVFTVESTDPTE